jgi:molecular chaperone GrpE
MLENLNAMMAVSDDNLGKLSQLLSAIAEGDLTARMHGDYQGVFARMRDDANTTVTQLTRIVGQIQASADSSGWSDLVQSGQLRLLATWGAERAKRFPTAAKADAENARRRAEEEIAKARKFALEAFAESLLPVADSLEAGLQIKDASAELIRIGTEATLKQLKSALERNRVMEIAPPAGTKFDPHQHQAISVVPAEQEANTVVGVLQKGYLIADRVLRPALVTVAAPK